MNGSSGREIAYEGGAQICIPTIISRSSMINGRQSQERPLRLLSRAKNGTTRRPDNDSSISGRDNSAAATPITPEIDEIDRQEGGRARVQSGMRRNAEPQFLRGILGGQ